MHQCNDNTNNDMTIQVLCVHIIHRSMIIGLQHLYVQFMNNKTISTNGYDDETHLKHIQQNGRTSIKLGI